MAELIGRTLEGYRIEAELGRGGQAIVYRATQESLQRTVALKVVSAQLSGDPGFMERFRREGVSAASLDHPHVIPVFEAGNSDGHAFLSMKYVEGPSLDGVIKSGGAVAVQRALALLRQVAEALDEIHRLDFVHRDVKPANILIGPGDHAYLSDFGLSKALADARLTGTGVWMGTFEYVSPEQIQGHDVTSAADRYSFGAVAYETLTGRPPFQREDRSAMLYAHLNSHPAAPSTIRPKLGEQVDTVLSQAMAKDPVHRYPTARAMVDALAAAVSATPGAARSTDPGSATVTGPPLDVATAAMAPSGATDQDHLPPTEPGDVVPASLPPTEAGPILAPIPVGAAAPASPPSSAGTPAAPPVPPGEGGALPDPLTPKPGPSGRPPWLIPAAIGGGLLAVIVVVLVIVLASGGGSDEPELVLVPPGPATNQPLGEIVPRQLPRWSLSGVDATTLNFNFPAGLVEGAEAAQASRGSDVALLIGIEPANASVVGAIEDGIDDEDPRFVETDAGRVSVYDVPGGIVAISSTDTAQYVAVSPSEADAVDLLGAVAQTLAAEG